MWILVLEGRMHDGSARRDVTMQGKREAAAHQRMMSTDVERPMEFICRTEIVAIRAPRKPTTVVAAAATARRVNPCSARQGTCVEPNSPPPIDVRSRREVWTFSSSARKNHT
jgi:hypothetical protein